MLEILELKVVHLGKKEDHTSLKRKAITKNLFVTKELLMLLVSPRKGREFDGIPLYVVRLELLVF